MKNKKLTLTLLTMLVLTACGQSGKLYLPEKELPPVQAPKPNDQEPPVQAPNPDTQEPPVNVPK